MLTWGDENQSALFFRNLKKNPSVVDPSWFKAHSCITENNFYNLGVQTLGICIPEVGVFSFKMFRLCENNNYESKLYKFLTTNLFIKYKICLTKNREKSCQNNFKAVVKSRDKKDKIG